MTSFREQFALKQKNLAILFYYLKEIVIKNYFVFMFIILFAAFATLSEFMGLAIVLDAISADGKWLKQFGISFNLISNSSSLSFALLILGCGILRFGFMYGTLLLKAKLERKLFTKVRSHVFSIFMHKDYQEYIKYSIGDLITIVENYTSSIIPFIAGLIEFSSVVIVILLYISLSLLVSFEATIYCVLIGAASMVLVKYFGQDYILNLSKKKLDLRNQMNDVTIDMLMGFKEVSISNKQDKAIEHHDNAINSFAKTHLQSIVATGFVDFISGVSAVFCISLIIFLNFAQGSEFQIQKILALIIIFSRISGPIQSIIKTFLSMLDTFPALTGMYNVLKNAPSVPSRDSGNKTTKDLKLQRGIYFQNVSFCYNNSSHKVIDNITFEIPKGQTTTIIGKSGQGKTTILNLLTGLLKPTSGEIYLDNQKIDQENLYLFREKIAYVSQKVFFFSGSIRENLEFFVSKGKTLNINNINEYNQMLQLSDFIGELKGGLDAPMGQGGSYFSGGQQQRLAILRALLTEKEIFIFDEATSNLDDVNQAYFYEYLKGLKGKTIIIVTHNLANAAKSDNVFILKGAKISPVGNVGVQKLRKIL